MDEITPIQREFTLPGTVEQVWDCLYDEDECSLWQGQQCEIGEKEGDEISLFGGWVTGKIIRVDPEKFLSYTWDSSDWEAGTPSSIVEYKLSKISENKTLVKLLHHTFPSKSERNNHDSGWDEHFFGPMTEYLKQVNE